MNCLENASILHVLLLVYLRFCIIKNPMTKVGPIRYRKVLLVVTWMIPIITKLPTFFFFLWNDHPLLELLVCITAQFLIFSAPCVLFIVIVYGRMILTIKNKKQEHRDALNLSRTATEKQFDDKTTRLISILVLVVCICYVPYLIMRTDLYVNLLTNLNDHAIPGTSCWKAIDRSNAVLKN